MTDDNLANDIGQIERDRLLRELLIEKADREARYWSGNAEPHNYVWRRSGEMMSTESGDRRVDEEEYRAAPPAIQVIIDPAIMATPSVVQRSRSLWGEMWDYVIRKIWGEKKAYDKQTSNTVR